MVVSVVPILLSRKEVSKAVGTHVPLGNSTNLIQGIISDSGIRRS